MIKPFVFMELAVKAMTYAYKGRLALSDPAKPVPAKPVPAKPVPAKSVATKPAPASAETLKTSVDPAPSAAPLVKPTLAIRESDPGEILTDEKAVVVIEWAERLGRYPLPNDVVRISIAGDGDEPRRIRVGIEEDKRA